MRAAVCSLSLLLGLACGGSAHGQSALDPGRRAVEAVAPAVVRVVAEEIAPVADQRVDDDSSAASPAATRARERSVGSGVVVGPGGLVLTCAHVVAGAQRIRVHAAGGPPAPAALLAAAPRDDLALLGVEDRRPLPVAPLGRAASLRPGDPVLALGCPYGLDRSVSRGVLSATGRRLRARGRLLPGAFLQTDAVTGPGSSGGALVDLSGRVVGLTVAVGARDGRFGFALPIERARAVLTHLLDPERLFGLDLGLDLAPSPDGRGLRVASVRTGGPAAAAGLHAGDRVVAAGPAAARDLFAFRCAFLLAEGGPVRLAVEGPDGRRRGALLRPAPSPAAALAARRLGLRGRRLRPAVAWRRGLPPGGLLVEAVLEGSPAARIGLRPGDVLLEVARRRPRLRRRLERWSDLGDALGDAPPGEPLALVVRRGGRLHRAVLRPR
ncbi:MAG: hypothetical protein D6731_07605 [Planctomycetota bacterium]|nr:MAG: hypothetical protein D6731_07605 [Planctomycetota bacterium]